MLRWTKTEVTSILSLLLLLYSADCHGDRDKRFEDEFHCCAPSQWTARVRQDSASVIDGINKYSETWTTIHFDTVNQRVAFTDMSGDGGVESVRTIEDYKYHSWTIVMEKGQRLCVIYNLTGDFTPRCTPRNISGVAFAVAGVLSPIQGVFANTVYYNHPDVTGHMTVTVGDCALVEEMKFYPSMKDHAVVDTIQYFNQTLTVDDSVFSIPHDCIYVPPDYASASARQTFSQLPRYHK